MRYLCVHCDKSFEHTDENKKPRCPECLRVNGLEKMAEPKAKKKAASAKAPAKPWLPWAIGAGLLAAGGVGYLIWSEQSSTTTTT
ncbi:MAG: hypothetical protein K8H88_26475, partial [Sandaracinaceae bacterium]|nr:hypothetical protein [Sandaracinaceae bacterium]